MNDKNITSADQDSEQEYDWEDDYIYAGWGDDEDPCDTCLNDCDGWDAQFCCIRCRYMG